MLLDLLDQGLSIREAAQQIDIRYENAKSIYRIYRLHNRKTKHTRLQMNSFDLPIRDSNSHDSDGKRSHMVRLKFKDHFIDEKTTLDYLMKPRKLMDGSIVLNALDRQAALQDAMMQQTKLIITKYNRNPFHQKTGHWSLPSKRPVDYF